MKNSSIILAFSALFLASCAHTSTTATYGRDARTQAIINAHNNQVDYLDESRAQQGRFAFLTKRRIDKNTENVKNELEGVTKEHNELTEQLEKHRNAFKKEMAEYE